MTSSAAASLLNQKADPQRETPSQLEPALGRRSDRSPSAGPKDAVM